MITSVNDTFDELLGTGRIAEAIEVERRQHIDDLCKTDSFILAVAKGEKSYETEIQFILDRYDSFWKRVLPPKPDAGFDEKVREIFKSLKQVENMPPCCYPDSAAYTTKERRWNMHVGIGTFAVSGAVCSGFLDVPLYFFVDRPNAFYETAGALLIGVGALVSGWGMLKQNRITTNGLLQLQAAAKKADRFIKEYAR